MICPYFLDFVHKILNIMCYNFLLITECEKIMIIFLLIVLAACAIQLFLLNNLIRTENFAQATVTKITDKKVKSGEQPNSIYYSFDFTGNAFNGFLQKFWLPQDDNEQKAGDKIGVYFVPENPKNNIAEYNIAGKSQIALILSAICLIFFLGLGIEEYNDFASNVFFYSWIPLTLTVLTGLIYWKQTKLQKLSKNTVEVLATIEKRHLIGIFTNCYRLYNFTININGKKTKYRGIFTNGWKNLPDTYGAFPQEAENINVLYLPDNPSINYPKNYLDKTLKFIPKMLLINFGLFAIWLFIFSYDYIKKYGNVKSYIEDNSLIVSIIMLALFVFGIILMYPKKK